MRGYDEFKGYRTIIVFDPLHGQFLCQSVRHPFEGPQAEASASVAVLGPRVSVGGVAAKPGEAIVRRYQLACSRGEAHAVTMPNVTETLVRRFVSDYLGWWNSKN